MTQETVSPDAANTGMQKGPAMGQTTDSIIMQRYQDAIQRAESVCPYDGSGHLFNNVAIDGNCLYLSVTDQDAVYRKDISDTSNLAEAALEYFVRVPGPNGILAVFFPFLPSATRLKLAAQSMAWHTRRPRQPLFSS